QPARADHAARPRFDAREVESFGILGNARQPPPHEAEAAVQRIWGIRLDDRLTCLAEPPGDFLDHRGDLRVDAAAWYDRTERYRDSQRRRRIPCGTRRATGEDVHHQHGIVNRAGKRPESREAQPVALRS